MVSTHGGGSSKCFGTDAPPKGTRDPVLDAWECAAAPWWNTGDLSRPFAASGPAHWARAKSVAAAEKVPARPLPKVVVGPVHEGVSSISFHVSRTGVPIEVKTSFFPNWKAHGAQGPWRLAPNMMVVVPTSHDVTLTYGETTGDRAGRLLTLAGVLGVFGLARYRPAAPAEPEPSAPTEAPTPRAPLWAEPIVADEARPPELPAPWIPPALPAPAEPVAVVEPDADASREPPDAEGDEPGVQPDDGPDGGAGPDPQDPALP